MLGPVVRKSTVQFASSTTQSVGELRFWMNWKEHEPFLLRLCLGWVGGSELEARELLSSAMLKAWEGAHKTKDEIGNYRAWLAKIVRHHCIDQQRKQNRDPQVKTDPELLVPIAEQSRQTHQASPESNLLKDESYTRLLARMDGLPLPLREVMMLRAYQNMSYKEIGQHLHISTENARKRVQTARSLLREDIGPELPAEEAQVSREEGVAADAILLADRLPDGGGFRFASPMRFEWLGLELELPVLHEYRPMRLQQKADTLRKYLARHPGGWKKELELARLCWAMGQANEALERIAAAIARQPQVPELVLIHLRMLQSLGDMPALASAARAALAEQPSLPVLEELYAGFAAYAGGDRVAAAQHWRGCEAIGGEVLLAQLWISSGRHAQAAALLRSRLRTKPMDREAFLWLAIAAKGSEDALENALLAQRRFPGDPYAAAIAAVGQWNRASDPAQTKAAMAEILRMAPDSYFAMGLRAAWAQHLQQPEKAAAVVAEFLDAHLRHYQALHFAHKLMQLQGNARKMATYGTKLQKLTQGKCLPPMELDIPMHFLECV